MSIRTPSLIVVTWALLALAALCSVVPFIWIVMGSLKPHEEVVKGHVMPWEAYEVAGAAGGNSPAATAPPNATHHVTLDNYRFIFTRLSGLPTYYFNTLYLALGGTLLTLLVGSLAAYGFARFRFAGNRLGLALLMMTLMIPAEVMLVGRYELMFHLRLYDKLAGLLACYVAGNLLLVIFIMRNVFAAIPQDIIDSAMIDGAGTWQVFWTIMIPIGGNGLAACGLLTFLGIWNEFVFALTFTSMDKVRTLPVGIVMLKGQFSLFNHGVLFASVLLSFLPIIVVFALLQKYFVRGLSAGALKG